MKHLSLLAAMVSLVACTGTTTGGSDGGTGGTSGTGGTGGTPITPVECTDCVEQTISWTFEGGLVQYFTTAAIAPCRSFTYTRKLADANPDNPKTACTRRLRG